jgi:deferrochelatase/peroxidase EfeB
MAINQFDPKHRQTLSEIQGNILKGHGREFVVGKPNRKLGIKKWLNELVDDNTGIIKSGYNQLYANHLWKTQKIDGGMFACIHISASGYAFLSNEIDAQARDNEVREKFNGHEAFLAGLQGRQVELKDPEVAEWDEGYQPDIHFHLLIADNNEANVKAKADFIKNDIEEFAEVVRTEFGNVIKNAEGAGIEHFGYVDGISQPLFFEDEMKDFRNDHFEFGRLNYDPTATMNLVLVQDPYQKSSQGSFFVFRKLEQDVRGFKKAEKALAEELGLKGEDEERAGAMIVGRFEDGTPVEVAGEAGMIGNSFYNNFNYDKDDASRCPYHAHIRKTNPRDELAQRFEGEDAKDAVMARRGIPYGKRTDDPFDGNNDTNPWGRVIIPELSS